MDHFHLCPKLFPALQWQTGANDAVYARLQGYADARLEYRICTTAPFFLAVVPGSNRSYYVATDYDVRNCDADTLESTIRDMLEWVRYKLEQSMQVLALCDIPEPDMTLPRCWHSAGDTLPAFALRTGDPSVPPLAVIRMLRHGVSLKDDDVWFWATGEHSGLATTKSEAWDRVDEHLPTSAEE